MGLPLDRPRVYPNRVLVIDGVGSLRAVAAAVLLSGLLAACSSGPPSLDGQPSLSTARVALVGGSPDLALSICTNLQARKQRDTSVMVCRADSLVAMGRSAEAVDVYQSALAIEPGLPEARLGLGRLRLASDPAAAEAYFLQVIAAQPRNAVALNNLGIARDLQGRHSDAQLAYGEAIAADPDSRPPQVNLALSLAMSGRAREAVRMLRPIAERPEATPRERHDLAAVLAMEGKPDEAARLLRPELDGAQSDEAVTGYRSLPSK